MVKKAPKDPQFAQKLEEQSRKMFGRAYRFLNATQKSQVNAETKFEPKEESNEPANTDLGVGEKAGINKVEQGNGKTRENDQEKKASPAPVLKHAEPFVDYVTQHKCEAGHITNGKVTAPPLGCRICDKPVKKIGYYVNDIFVPVA